MKGKSKSQVLVLKTSIVLSHSHIAMKSTTRTMKRLALSISALAVNTRAALVPVSNFGDNPTGLQMSIYVPDKLATKPPVILAVCRHLKSRVYLNDLGFMLTSADARMRWNRTAVPPDVRIHQAGRRQRVSSYIPDNDA
jgi:hypothetical protein